MAAEQPASTGSLEDRISKPSGGINVAAATFVPGQKTSWADEVSSPADDKLGAATGSETKEEIDSIAAAQVDGASEPLGGSTLTEPEYDVNVRLADIQADPNNPLYSVKSFEQLGLPKEILDGIYLMSFTKPSKIQEKALPLLMKNPPENMIGQSQSGTGKTAAFVLNMLSRLNLQDVMANTPQALCLAPSRELARQIVGVIQMMGQFIPNLKVMVAIPMDIANRTRTFDASIIVGTPGTTTDMIKKRQLDPRQIKVLVLDEADNMLDQQGLGDQCLRVKQMLPKSVQVVLFSATFPDKVIDYAKKFAPNSNQITLRHEELTVEGIRQLYMDVASEEDKYAALTRLYGLMTIGSSIIFVKRRDTAAEIERRMTAEGHKVASLTGAFEGAQRDVIIDAFRSGKAKVLIATNVLSRGIDIQTVSMVVNYDLPDEGTKPGVPDPQTYLHRIGRTGRFGRLGVSISFIKDKKEWEMLMEISKYFQVSMTRLDNNDWDSVEETVKRVIKSTTANLQARQGNAGPGSTM